MNTLIVIMRWLNLLSLVYYWCLCILKSYMYVIIMDFQAWWWHIIPFKFFINVNESATKVGQIYSQCLFAQEKVSIFSSGVTYNSLYNVCKSDSTSFAPHAQRWCLNSLNVGYRTLYKCQLQGI